MSRRPGLVVAAAIALLGGCGVPTGGEPDTIAPSDVPFDLIEPASPTPASPSSRPRLNEPRIFLIGPDDVLLPSGREVPEGTTRERLADVLDQLAAGPTAGERDDGLATALTPGERLTVTAFDEGVATVDLAGTGEVPSGQQSRRAVGQIVLTATSLPEVEAVRLTLAGDPLEAPLPSGELTSAALTAADYQAFLVEPPS